MSPQRLRRALLIPAFGGGVFMLLVALLTVAARQPALGWLSPLPSLTRLSAVRLLGALSPLDDAYIRRVLGFPAASATSPGAAGRGITSTSAITAPSSGAVSRPATVSVDHPFTNDDFEHAYRVPSVPFTARTETSSASRQSGEPTACAAVGGTAWYRYTPTRDGALFADTFGTKYADALGVFTGSSLAALHKLACGTSATGEAQAQIHVDRGTTYWFQITAPAGGGPTVFSLVPVGSSVAFPGSVANEESPVSDDGRHVAYARFEDDPASLGNCLAGERSACPRLYVQDLRTGRRKSLLLLGAGPVTDPQTTQLLPVKGMAISGDGRYVAVGSDDQTRHGSADAITQVYVVDTVTGKVELVSRSADGTPARTLPTSRAHGSCGVVQCFDGADHPYISADGRYVAFTSNATNLVPGASPRGDYRCYVHDRITGTNQLVPFGAAALQVPEVVAICRGLSSDGLTALVYAGADDAATAAWVAAADLGRKVARRITPASGPGSVPLATALSRDGRTAAVVYDTSGTDVVSTTSAGLAAVDIRTGRVDVLVPKIASTDSQPADLTGSLGSLTVTVNRDGRYVFFPSSQPGLVPGSSRAVDNVYAFDRLTRGLARISVNSDGSKFTVNSYFPQVSGDGRVVSFFQAAANGGILVLHTSMRPGVP